LSPPQLKKGPLASFKFFSNLHLQLLLSPLSVSSGSNPLVANLLVSNQTEIDGLPSWGLGNGDEGVVSSTQVFPFPETRKLPTSKPFQRHHIITKQQLPAVLVFSLFDIDLRFGHITVARPNPFSLT
jgi:hypothetical protein